MHISAYHFQTGMAQYLLQPENIATVMEQEIGSKGMPAQMSMQSGYTCFLTPAIDQQFGSIRSQGFTVEGKEEVVIGFKQV